MPTDLEWLSAAQLRSAPPRLDMCALFMTLFKLDSALFKSLTRRPFFSTPPLQLSRCVFNWVPKCGCVERYWNTSHMVGGEKECEGGGSLRVCGTWINLCDVNKRVDAHRISRKTAGADLDDIPAALYQRLRRITLNDLVTLIGWWGEKRSPPKGSSLAQVSCCLSRLSQSDSHRLSHPSQKKKELFWEPAIVLCHKLSSVCFFFQRKCHVRRPSPYLGSRAAEQIVHCACVRCSPLLPESDDYMNR